MFTFILRKAIKKGSFIPSFLIFALQISVFQPTYSQIVSESLSLEKVIAIAQQSSLDSYRAKHRYKGSYWQFRAFKAGYLPQLSFDASLPNLNRSISAITLPDGNDIFIRRSLATSSSNLSLTQSLGLTGGQVFLSSGLQRIDIIKDSIITSYSTNPITIGISQPLFGFNAFKWEKKIEPLRYKESEKQFIEDNEQIAINATNYFFNLLNAEINVGISQSNYSNNDTLYKIALGRYNLGKIAENELLEMELNLLNSQASLEQTKIDYQAALFKFKSYLSIKNNEPIQLELPLNFSDFSIDAQKAIAYAQENRSEAISFNKNLLEVNRDVAKAKADNRFNIRLYASYGLTQSAALFSDAYLNPLDQQQLLLGLQIPLIDWGMGKGRIKMAESYRDLVKTNIEQAVIDFEQEIFLKTLHFNMLAKQLQIAAKADTIALKRYDVTKQRFLIGRIDIIPLNLAQEAKDRATQAYINALRSYWVAYYEMRKLTHYDFVHNKKIEYTFAF